MAPIEQTSLEFGSTMVLGPFNPHIITPKWLLSEGIVGVHGEGEWEDYPASKGIAFEMTEFLSQEADGNEEENVEEKTYWEIDFESLLISSETADCGHLAGAVINTLHHTPVKAVGHNFHYSIPKSSWPEHFLPVIGTVNRSELNAVLEKNEGSEIGQFRWSCVFFQNDVRVELSVAESNDVVLFSANFHCPTNSTEEAEQFAKNFNIVKNRSMKLLTGFRNIGEEKR